ncbi:MAG: biliverdin-producing heme oxygenase [Flavobacteriaceae bacterium]
MFLRLHARVLPAAEDALENQSGFHELPNALARLRSGDLEHDLAALGLEPPPAEALSFVNDRAVVAGIAYVLEGSRLGARLLLKDVLKSDRELPVSFLRHGAGTRFWGSFIEWLDGQTWSDADIERACGAAEAIFDAYISASRNETERLPLEH